MAAYLISGRSGTGKSTVYKELIRRGFIAYDSDTVPGLASWVDIATERKINKDYPGHDQVDKFKVKWDEETLKELLNQPDTVFICGSANNAFDFMPLFTKTFVLDLDAAEQRRRINNRTEHDYGKDSGVQDGIIAYQKETVAHAREFGAIIIDASDTVEHVTNKILSFVTPKGNNPVHTQKA